MITFILPSGREYRLTDAVFDYNGTLAEDGILSEEIKALLERLAETIRITILTADTYGAVRTQLQNLSGIQLRIIKRGQEAEQKRDFVRSCGRENTICFGNGANDSEMFSEAALAVCVIGAEGAYQPTLAKADIVVTSPVNAISLLLKQTRIIATLRA